MRRPDQRRTPRAGRELLDVRAAYGTERRTPSRSANELDVAALASAHHGVVSRSQLRTAGVPPRTIARRIEQGHLHVLHRGVYAVGHTALSWEGRAQAALLAVGEDAILSHRSAAVACRMRQDDGGAIEVTVIGRMPRHRPGIRVHTAKALDVRRVAGLPVTTPARTLLDLAADAPADEVARAFAEAQVLRLVTPAAVAAELRRNPTHHGARTIGRLLSTAEPTRSELERRVLRLIAGARLPRPLVNTRVGGVEVDLLWPDHRVVVELDGWAAHGHRTAFERDRARDAALHALGYVVLRFTWRQVVEEPLVVVTRIAQVLSSNRYGAGAAA